MRVDEVAPDELLEALRAYPGQIDDLEEGLSVDARALADARREASSSLRAAGLESGDRVAFAVGNGPRFAAAFGAVLEAGACPLLLHHEAPPAELGRFAARYAARFVVTDARPPDGADARPLGAGWMAPLVGAVVPRAEGDVDPYPRLTSVPLHPTSGTTGEPKVAVRPARAALAEARHYARAIGIGADDTILATVPMSHAYGYGMCWMVPLLTGARIVTARRPNPRAVQGLWRERRMTILPTVAALLDLLTRGAPQALGGPADIRVFSAGAPLSVATAAAFAGAFGAPVRSLYGTTETGGIAVARGAPAERGDVGPPMDGVELELRPVEPDGAGDERRVCVSSASMMAGYLARGDIDRSALPGGWFETGDLAHRAPDGSLVLRGRQADVINVFGLKVLPAEVEEVIRAAEGVRDVAVYAGTHRTGAATVKAAIVARPGLDVGALRAHCAEQLAAYKCPQEIVLVEQLPRTGSGKILRSQLP